MAVELIQIYIAIPAAVAMAILALLGYRQRKRSQERRRALARQRWPSDPFV